MDSLAQIALGAAVSVAVMGRRAGVVKAAAWGAVAGTLPDLDVLLDHGDPIANMVLHRAQSHSLFWLSVFSIPFALAIAKIHGQWDLRGRWWVAMWLALVTHPLLDVMTVYGTQLGLPFANRPYAVGSVFIIDLLYTVPLLVGTVWALSARASPRGTDRGLRANAVGLVLSTAYLGWGVVAQAHATRVANESLVAQGIAAQHVLVTPAPFNSLLWRVVAVSGDGYYEGFYSVLDAEPRMGFDRFARGTALAAELQTNRGVQRIQAFSQGFYKLHEQAGKAFITDLRMGQEPNYIFSFAVAQRGSDWVALDKPEQQRARPDIARGLPWLWQRMWGDAIPPPR
jgi:inner membrane protein